MKDFRQLLLPKLEDLLNIVLYDEAMDYRAADPNWEGRDRFVS